MGTHGIGMTSARTHARMVERLRESGIRDEVVLAALLAIPRHRFVDEALAIRAYDDVPLPIGHGQTISQPWVVARMSDLARNGRELDGVLEIGTGCGYQTAVLAALGAEVFSIEILPALSESAAARLRELGVRARLFLGDGHLGLPEYAPYDAILVTAAPPHIPRPLVEQLAPGGRLVVPVGAEHADQELLVVRRSERGEQVERVAPVRFVPMTGGERGSSSSSASFGKV